MIATSGNAYVFLNGLTPENCLPRSVSSNGIKGGRTGPEEVALELDPILDALFSARLWARDLKNVPLRA